MRCVFRGLLIGLLILVTIIYFFIRALNNASEPDYEEVIDEAARRILEGEAEPGATDRPGVSVSVAVILIVCLISVLLLITGIIIVAITLDPTTEEDDDSEIESEDSRPLMETSSFFTHSEYDNLFAETAYEDDPTLYSHRDL